VTLHQQPEDATESTTPGRLLLQHRTSLPIAGTVRKDQRRGARLPLSTRLSPLLFPSLRSGSRPPTTTLGSLRSPFGSLRSPSRNPTHPRKRKSSLSHPRTATHLRTPTIPNTRIFVGLSLTETPTTTARIGPESRSGFARKSDVLDADNRVILLRSRGEAFSAPPRTPSAWVTLRNRTSVIRVDLGGPVPPKPPVAASMPQEKGSPPCSPPGPNGFRHRTQPHVARRAKVPVTPRATPGTQSSTPQKRKAGAPRNRRGWVRDYGGLRPFLSRTS